MTSLEQIKLIRELIDRAERRPTVQWATGDLILAVSRLTDLIAATLPGVVEPEGEIGKAALQDDQPTQKGHK